MVASEIAKDIAEVTHAVERWPIPAVMLTCASNDLSKLSCKLNQLIGRFKVWKQNCNKIHLKSPREMPLFFRPTTSIRCLEGYLKINRLLSP